MLEIIGQLLGIAAVVTGFISFQMKTPKGILVFQLIASVIFSAHYLCIAAYTASALNLLGAVKCLVFYLREKRGSKSIVSPLIFSVLVVVTSLMTWEGWYSALIMVALVVNTFSLAMGNAQKTRWCMFIKSPLCLVYNILVTSGGGIIYECAVLVSSTIGILRNRRREA